MLGEGGGDGGRSQHTRAGGTGGGRSQHTRAGRTKKYFRPCMKKRRGGHAAGALPYMQPQRAGRVPQQPPRAPDGGGGGEGGAE